MWFTSRANGLVGVDITSATVKLIELESVAGGHRVVSHAVGPLRQGAVVERRIRDMGEVIEVLSRVVERAAPRSRHAAVAVPSGAAITRLLRFPADLNEDQVEARIEWESDKHIPFPFREVAFDFQCLGECVDDPAFREWLLVACRRHDVEQLTQALEASGLVPAAVDVENFAIERAMAGLYRRLQMGDEALALVDVGAYLNALHVLEAGRIIYSHDSLYGGMQLTEAIQRHYGMSLDEAGFAKKRGGLPGDYGQAVLLPFLDTLIGHIENSLQLYRVSGGFRPLSRLLVAGGTSLIGGFAERLSESIGLPVSLVDPLEGMNIASSLDVDAVRAEAPALLTACGLALRGRA
ncbi:pilus assembly protein PilM [Halomonas denitrificans]|uniref:type IV pilus assembly protein PilM n=1 Tax=Halomonas denitrificans TaxID=370769 RepID=UPI001CD7D77B|nr:type IV pilus assembly protein PilM [Halomonas denitrificans]MCA0976013.1 pilus assembly protein PilM [Halomonas denitrificans]